MKWLFFFCAIASAREVAITIDDLPLGGDNSADYATIRAMTARLLAPFRDEKIPLIGFVNMGRTRLAPDELRNVMKMWLDAGAELGNHTWSHAGLNDTPVDRFEEEILKNDAALRPIFKNLKYFRYPYLQVGPTVESKTAIAKFLEEHGYRDAPVTFDDSDYLFAAAYLKPELKQRVEREYVPYLESVIAWFEKRSVEVVGHEFRQILLLHANELNSRKMPEILAMLRKRGYKFISLDQALKDDAYKLPENYVGKGGFSYIHRWSRAKGMPNAGEPDEPEWVRPK